MLLLGIIFSFIISHSTGQFIVEILQPPTGRGIRHPVERCDATGANFGADVASFSFSQHAIGCPVTVNPERACGNVTFNPDQWNTTSCNNLFGIVPRGQCNFSEKAYHVQTAKPIPLSAIIVYNEKEKGPPVDMNGGKYSEKVKIPVLMVSYDCMNSILEKYPPTKGYVLQIKISPGYYDLFRYLIPFVVVVGFCFMVLLISLAIRLCRERRRIARKRLSKRNLKKIPTKKYKKGDYPETCAICLEDFVEGEKLRVLPCRHTYHCLCIDPWLTQNRKVCPMCKRRVGAKNSDSESSDDERRRRDQPSTSVTSTAGSNYDVRIVDESGPSGLQETAQPQPGVSNVLVEVHHNGHMGSQEQLVDEDFLAQMENHMSDDELEQPQQESMSQSFRARLKNIFNRSGHRPLEEEEDDDHHGRDNSGFHGSTPSVAAAHEEEVPTETTPSAGYQFLDPFEHHNETDNQQQPPAADQQPPVL